MTKQTTTTGPDGTAGDSTSLVTPTKQAGDDNDDHGGEKMEEQASRAKSWRQIQNVQTERYEIQEGDLQAVTRRGGKRTNDTGEVGEKHDKNNPFDELMDSDTDSDDHKGGDTETSPATGYDTNEPRTGPKRPIAQLASVVAVLAEMNIKIQLSVWQELSEHARENPNHMVAGIMEAVGDNEDTPTLAPKHAELFNALARHCEQEATQGGGQGGGEEHDRKRGTPAHNADATSLMEVFKQLKGKRVRKIQAYKPNTK
ncbi:hypothetical protein TrRE_jg1906, partial [Triparma retinervis]